MQSYSPTPYPTSPTHTVFLTGALNAAAMDEIRDVFESMVRASSQEVIIDLSEVNKLDASGVGALVFLFKRLRNTDRHLTITGVHGQPEAIIRLLRLEKAIDTQFMQ